MTVSRSIITISISIPPQTYLCTTNLVIHPILKVVAMITFYDKRWQLNQEGLGDMTPDDADKDRLLKAK
jgi:hypothetical protein